MSPILASLVSLLALCATPSASAPATTPAVARFAEGAGDAAIQALIHVALAQTAASRRRLSSELAALPEAERGLREFIAQSARLAPPETLADGRIQRTATLATEKINAFLAQLAASDPYLLDIRRLRLMIPATHLSANGAIFPDEGPFDHRPGWRYCRQRDLARVRSAAAEDLRLVLLVSLADLRIAADQSLGELLAQDESARRRLQEKLATLPLPEATLEPEGVCRMRLTLTRRQSIGLLEAALSAPDAPLPGIDWSRLTAGVPLTLTVNGYAVAPPSPGWSLSTQPSVP